MQVLFYFKRIKMTFYSPPILFYSFHPPPHQRVSDFYPNPILQGCQIFFITPLIFAPPSVNNDGPLMTSFNH